MADARRPLLRRAAALARCRLGFGGALWPLLVRTDSWLRGWPRTPARWPRRSPRAAGIAPPLLDRAGRLADRDALRTQPLDDPWRRLTAPLGRATLTTRRR